MGLSAHGFSAVVCSRKQIVLLCTGACPSGQGTKLAREACGQLLHAAQHVAAAAHVQLEVSRLSVTTLRPHWLQTFRAILFVEIMLVTGLAASLSSGWAAGGAAVAAAAFHVQHVCLQQQWQENHHQQQQQQHMMQQAW
jgi:hypothetical protein